MWLQSPRPTCLRDPACQSPRYPPRGRLLRRGNADVFVNSPAELLEFLTRSLRDGTFQPDFARRSPLVLGQRLADTAFAFGDVGSPIDRVKGPADDNAAIGQP